jgi:PilZ domain
MNKAATSPPKSRQSRAPRVRSQLPVLMNGKRGTTEDISATGVFFEIEDEQSVGSIVKFKIELDTPGGKLNVECRAEIIRLEKVNGKTKLAAKILNQTIKTI